MKTCILRVQYWKSYDCVLRPPLITAFMAITQLLASNAAALFPSSRVPSLVFRGREPVAKEIRRLHWRLHSCNLWHDIEKQAAQPQNYFKAFQSFEMGDYF